MSLIDLIADLERRVDRLTSENAAWMNGVADVVEPYGFNREAACGPADLLPGLGFLLDDIAALRAGER